MATIGYRKQGALAQTAKLWIRGLLVPVGVPSASYSDQVAWGAWPDPLSGLEADPIDATWSMYLTDDGAGLVSKATACVSWFGGFGTKRIKMALCDTSFNLLGTTNEITRSTNSGLEWIDFTFSTPVQLTYGTPVIILAWGNTSTAETGISMRYDVSPDLDYWDPMPAGNVAITVTESLVLTDEAPGAGDIDIAITVEETLALADTYIRASHCWGRYAEPDDECDNLYDDDDQQIANLYSEV